MREWFAVVLGVLLLSCSARAQAWEVSFNARAAGEAVADILASSPGGSWLKLGAEAAVATIALDEHYNQGVVIDRGAHDETYPVFLGRHRGPASFNIERNPRWFPSSMPGPIRRAIFPMFHSLCSTSAFRSRKARHCSTASFSAMKIVAPRPMR